MIKDETFVEEEARVFAEHQRMYAALLQIKRLYEKENGKFDKAYDQMQSFMDAREIWNIACRGLGKAKVP